MSKENRVFFPLRQKFPDTVTAGFPVSIVWSCGSRHCRLREIARKTSSPLLRTSVARATFEITIIFFPGRSA